MLQTDFLIIGQGLAGSILAYSLLERGKKVIVLDEPSLQHCSIVAAGLCNPITGRNLTTTWKATQLFDLVHQFYPKIAQQTGQQFFFPTPIYRPFQDLIQQQDWLALEKKGKYEVVLPKENRFGNQINDPFGGLLIQQGAHLRTDIFLQAMKEYLIAKESYRCEKFEFENVQVQATNIQYRDIQAQHLIFCRGYLDKDNPFFAELPLAPAKGEILHVSFAEQPNFKDKIINKGCWLVPFGEHFRTGSTYDHQDLSLLPTQKAKQMIEEKLRQALTISYHIHQQDVGIRPATKTRKPLLGSNPKYSTIHLFNGFGAKGTSMIPYFAQEFADYLLLQKPLEKDVSIDKYFS